MEWIAVLVVLGCFGVGKYYKYYTDSIDSPVEQISESILRSKGIEVDFSADKKKALEQEKKSDKKS